AVGPPPATGWWSRCPTWVLGTRPSGALRPRNGRLRSSSSLCSMDCRTRSLPSAQILEPCQAVWPQHNRRALDGEAPGLDPLRGRRDHEQARSPVIGIAAVEPHYRPVTTGDHSVAVVFDFVDPVWTGRRS